MCWQQHAGVGDQFDALSACKRTRDEAPHEAPIRIAQATSSGIWRSVGARGNQSAAEIAKGYLASSSRTRSFGCAIGKNRAALAGLCDLVPDTAGPPQPVKRVLELLATTLNKSTRVIRSAARPRRSDRRRSGLLRAAFFNRCAVLSALVRRRSPRYARRYRAERMESSVWLRLGDRERQSSYRQGSGSPSFGAEGRRHGVRLHAAPTVGVKLSRLKTALSGRERVRREPHPTTGSRRRTKVPDCICTGAFGACASAEQADSDGTPEPSAR
jgi:hypothetical protein